MEKGTRPQLTESKDKLIPQSKIVERLKKIFQPGKNHSYYHVVYGEYGTGKTILTRIIANEVGKGIIYIDIPANSNKLDNEFGRALNLTFEEDVSLIVQLFRKIFKWTKDDKFTNSHSKWERTMDAIKQASEVYKVKHGKLPVIIYDNIDRLVYKNPEILDILQDDAKDNADDRKYIAVFVSSEGLVPRRMESCSAWSRANKPIIEIGDLSKEESMKYLVDKCKIKEEEAKRLYELVGSRIIDLKSVADKFLDEKSFEVIKQQILTEVEKKFDSANFHKDQLHYNAGKSVINALLDSKEINANLFKKIFKDKNYSEVLKANVFAYHPSRNTITFHSQSIEFYIRENFNIFTK